MDNRIIYLDNASTTKPREEVIEAVNKSFKHYYANPSSIHSLGGVVKEQIIRAKETIMHSLNANSINDIYFTSGGTESNNWVFKGIVNFYNSNNDDNFRWHIITTKIEHPSILEACKFLTYQNKHFDITYLDVDSKGRISLEDLENNIKQNTILISVMFANNEIGTIQPIKEIGEIAAKHGILFHTDAVQAYGSVPIDVQEMHIDLLSASAHKINGIKGTGFLYCSFAARHILSPFIHGGGQENGMRSGTENVPGIIGLDIAANIAMENLEDRSAKESYLRDYMIEKIIQEIPDASVNGDTENRLPNNINMYIPTTLRTEVLILSLASFGIYCSSGSACSSASNKPSHVLKAIGLSDDKANHCLRFTLGHDTTKQDINYTIDRLKFILNMYSTV